MTLLVVSFPIEIYMSCVKRKPAFCISVNKMITTQLIFAYIDRTIPLLLNWKFNLKSLATFCGCTAWFVSDLVGIPENRFSHNAAYMSGNKIACHKGFLVENSFAAGSQGIIEPRCEKTGLRGFQPGPIQTGLYSHIRWLEA